MDVRWRYGVFLGRALSSDQNVIGLSDGSTTRARAITRVVPSARWDAGRVLRLSATTCQEQPLSLETIEAEMSPHDGDSAELEGMPAHPTSREQNGD